MLPRSLIFMTCNTHAGTFNCIVVSATNSSNFNHPCPPSFASFTPGYLFGSFFPSSLFPPSSLHLLYPNSPPLPPFSLPPFFTSSFPSSSLLLPPPFLPATLPPPLTCCWSMSFSLWVFLECIWDSDGPVAQVLAWHGLDCSITSFKTGKVDESKSLWISCVWISHNLQRIY